MTYLPTPYESAPSDDLAAALAAGLAVTVSGITAFVLGTRSWTEIDILYGRGVDLGDLPTGQLLLLAGWAVATVLLVLGALLMVFRRGRGALTLGSLLSIGAAILAQVEYDFDQVIPQWPLYWGGVVVLAVLMLPATGRWVKRTARRQPALIGTVTTGGAPF